MHIQISNMGHREVFMEKPIVFINNSVDKISLVGVAELMCV